MPCAMAASVSICPFTLKSIADTPRLDLAVVKHSDDSEPCGGVCTLSKLIPYLHDSTSTSHAKCPLCQKSKITAVYDVEAASFLRGRGFPVSNDNSGTELITKDIVEQDGRIVSFMYGTIAYHLWAHLNHSSKSDINDNALRRLTNVMMMDVNRSLKVRSVEWLR